MASLLFCSIFPYKSQLLQLSRILISWSSTHHSHCVWLGLLIFIPRLENLFMDPLEVVLGLTLFVSFIQGLQSRAACFLVSKIFFLVYFISFLLKCEMKSLAPNYSNKTRSASLYLPVPLFLKICYSTFYSFQYLKNFFFKQIEHRLL